MKNNDRLLWVAGILGVGALLLLGASMTITAIAALRPPVPEHLDAALNDRLAPGAMSGVLIGSILAVVAFWQIIARRPVPYNTEAWTRRRPITNAALVMSSVVCLAVIMFLAFSLSNAIKSISLQGDRPITSSPAFGGIGLNFSVVSCVCSTLSGLYFIRWWQDSQAKGAAGARGLLPDVV